MHRSIPLAILLAIPMALLAMILVLNQTYGLGDGSQSYVLRIELPPADGKVGLPPIEGPPDARRPLVVIDAGHGGHDPGAGIGKHREKDLTLAIALAIRAELLREGGVRVAMTRDEDRYLLLPERADIARRLRADLFISVHADSAESDTARGASVYVLSDKGSSEAAARFAARENRADTINGVSFAQTSDAVDAILLDLSQREAQAGAYQMASLVLREIREVVPMHRDAVQSAAFAVLKAPDIPSILFETGYISNAEDEAFLASERGQEIIARAAARAIRVFFARQSVA